MEKTGNRKKNKGVTRRTAFTPTPFLSSPQRVFSFFVTDLKSRTASSTSRKSRGVWQNTMAKRVWGFTLLAAAIVVFSTLSTHAQTGDSAGDSAESSRAESRERDNLPPPPGLFDGGVSEKQVLEDAEVKTESGTLISRVAPGEFLPLSIKLLNFGGGRRVDVIIEYKIFDKGGNTVLSENETVAVETTASFVKLLQVPPDTLPGEYIARSSILYQDQVVPATAQFPFTVERKIAGIFLSQFILYSSVALFIGIVFCRRQPPCYQTTACGAVFAIRLFAGTERETSLL